ncbi:MAG TPA: alcohol dehydrogenase catalytic domain-containing protein [Steroidobacteraceae bacterium]|nr:alcohol dehydrogenase catalytic domain-containing protein [Steroidobacteraceae bacterium]
MQAAIFEGIGRPLKLEILPDPTPGGADVLIKVDHCGICGSDLHITEDPIFGVPAGSVLGHEYSGEVVAVGGQAGRIKPGDRVSVLPLRSCCTCPACLNGDQAWCAQMRIEGGGYGQYALANEGQCVLLPRTVSLQDGALVEPLAVALHGVNIAAMAAGARVLVIGAGPIGLATAFWARRLGAVGVAVTASSNRRAELAHTLGATAFIDPEAFTPQEVQRVLRGAPDIVFECVGKPGLVQKAIEHVRPRGTVVVLGLCTVPDSFSPFLAVVKEVRIQPAALYRVRDFEICIDVLDSGDVAPRAMVTDTVSLEQLPAAFEQLKSRTHQCKVLVNPWGTG